MMNSYIESGTEGALITNLLMPDGDSPCVQELKDEMHVSMPMNEPMVGIIHELAVWRP